MGITILPSGNYQARLKGADGKLHSETFQSKKAAEERLNEWKFEKQNGVLGKVEDRSITVAQFFDEWYQDVSNETAKELQSGWRKQQLHYFRSFISPVIGSCRLRAVTPQMIKRIFIGMTSQGKAPQTQRLVYATLKKMFGDAVENYQYLTVNPVLRKLKPTIALKEARHLNLYQVKQLLKYTEDKECGLAIWIQLYLGLRLGELIALKWEDVDISPNLTSGRIHIRRTFVSKTGFFRDYPKGGRHHSHSIPSELLQKLVRAKVVATTPFIVNSPKAEQLPYKWYMRHLKKYCSELNVPVVATHGLRHSTSELYIHHGATRDDLRRLFAHSSPTVTDRYVHDRGTNLEKIAQVIQLFPVVRDHETTTTG